MSRITVRLPEDLHRRLRAESERTGTSLNALVIKALSKALPRDDHPRDDERRPLTPREEELRQVRLALGDLVVEIDYDAFPPHLRPGDDLPDRDEYRRSMPKLEPPLSQTIIEEREDRF